MAKIGTNALERLVDLSGLTVQEKAAAKATLRALRDDYNDRHATPPPPPPPVVVPSVFQQPGWFAVRFDALPAPAELVAAGVKWVAAVLSHGVDAAGGHSLDTDDRENQAWLAAGRALPYLSRGIKVGGWGWSQVAPEREAEIAVIYVSNWTLDLWIANAEEVWKPDSPQFVHNGPERWCQAFERARTRSFPVGWSVLGAAVPPNVFGYDYAAFTRRGWRILPQAYPQQSIEYKLSTCINHAVKAGVPLDLVHPTIANYNAQKPAAYKPTLGEWQAELQEARARGVTGFSVWAHDFTVAQASELVAAAR